MPQNHSKNTYLEMKKLLILHYMVTGKGIVYDFCDKDIAIQIVEGEDDGQGELNFESRLFYRLEQKSKRPNNLKQSDQRSTILARSAWLDFCSMTRARRPKKESAKETAIRRRVEQSTVQR